MTCRERAFVGFPKRDNQVHERPVYLCLERIPLPGLLFVRSQVFGFQEQGLNLPIATLDVAWRSALDSAPDVSSFDIPSFFSTSALDSSRLLCQDSIVSIQASDDIRQHVAVRTCSICSICSMYSRDAASRTSSRQTSGLITSLEQRVTHSVFVRICS
jgi:hypothetical protein